MEKYIVTLTAEEREELTQIVSTDNHKSSKVRNAYVLLNCDRGEFQDKPIINEKIADVLRIGMRTIDRLKKCFVNEGLDVALNGKKSKRVYERKVDGDIEARLVALSCSEPPEGYGRWSLRLLADKAVELQFVESISHETIRRTLKKTKLNRGESKDG